MSIGEQRRCPTCGASPCHQKHKLHRLVDIGKMDSFDVVNPVDGVMCFECGEGFVVYRLEVEDPYFCDLTEQYENVPAFCPFCGAKLERYWKR